MYNLVLLFTLNHFDCIPACHFLCCRNYLSTPFLNSVVGGPINCFYKHKRDFFACLVPAQNVFPFFEWILGVCTPRLQPQRKSLYWIILQNLRGIKSGQTKPTTRSPRGKTNRNSVCVLGCVGGLQGVKHKVASPWTTKREKHLFTFLRSSSALPLVHNNNELPIPPPPPQKKKKIKKKESISQAHISQPYHT